MWVTHYLVICLTWEETFKMIHPWSVTIKLESVPVTVSDPPGITRWYSEETCVMFFHGCWDPGGTRRLLFNCLHSNHSLWSGSCSLSENTGKQQPGRRQACQHLCTAGTGSSLGAALPSGLAWRAQCTQAGLDRVGYDSRHLLGCCFQFQIRISCILPGVILLIGCEGIADIMPVISRLC